MSIENLSEDVELKEEIKTDIPATSEQPPKLSADFDAVVSEQEETNHIIDKEGSIFDPSIHDTNPDGTPKYRMRKGESTGIFAKKRGNRKGSNGHSAPPKSRMEPTVDQTTEMVAFSPEVMSALLTTGYFQTMAVVLGKEFAEPIRQTFYDEYSGKSVTFDEASMMQNAVKGIMVKKGVKSASPEAMLCLTMLTGVAVRANMEGSDVRGRIMKPFASTKDKIKSWFAARRKRKVEAKEKREQDNKDD